MGGGRDCTPPPAVIMMKPDNAPSSGLASAQWLAQVHGIVPHGSCSPAGAARAQGGLATTKPCAAVWAAVRLLQEVDRI